MGCVLITFSSCGTAPVKSGTASDANCHLRLERVRTEIISAESHPATSADGALQRLGDLNKLESVLPAGFSITGPIGLESFGTPYCADQNLLKLQVYLLWDEVLKDQINDFFLPSATKCRNWRSATLRYDVLNDAASVSQLEARLGRRDPDLNRVDGLVRHWGQEAGLRLPPLTRSEAIEKLAAAYARTYNRLEAGLPKGC